MIKINKPENIAIKRPKSLPFFTYDKSDNTTCLYFTLDNEKHGNIGVINMNTGELFNGVVFDSIDDVFLKLEDEEIYVEAEINLKTY